MEDPRVWALIWLAFAAAFGVGEMIAAGTFFLMPFAIGAFVAAIVSLIGAPVGVGWVTFLIVSFGSFLVLKPLARRMNSETPSPPGTGANRLVGLQGVVTESVPTGAGTSGLVSVMGEEWRAEGRDGMGVASGTEVRVIKVSGTRLIVEPASQVGLGQL